MKEYTFYNGFLIPPTYIIETVNDKSEKINLYFDLPEIADIKASEFDEKGIKYKIISDETPKIECTKGLCMVLKNGLKYKENDFFYFFVKGEKLIADVLLQNNDDVIRNSIYSWEYETEQFVTGCDVYISKYWHCADGSPVSLWMNINEEYVIIYPFSSNGIIKPNCLPFTVKSPGFIRVREVEFKNILKFSKFAPLFKKWPMDNSMNILFGSYGIRAAIVADQLCSMMCFEHV